MLDVNVSASEVNHEVSLRIKRPLEDLDSLNILFETPFHLIIYELTGFTLIPVPTPQLFVPSLNVNLIFSRLLKLVLQRI